MNVCIVGHGESLRGAGLGPKIDACDFVVRLKNCSMLLAQKHDYGKKTNAMCGSTEVLPTLLKVKAPEYWGYPKKGEFSEKRLRWFKRHVDQGSKISIPLEVCNLWNSAFLELGGKHRNLSTGLGAMVIALELKKPEVLYLAGFDNVWAPSTPGYSSTVPTVFNKGGTQSTGHDWGKENELLGYLATAFKVKIKDLAGKYGVTPG